MLIYAPLYVFPFRGVGAEQAVVQDGVDGQSTAFLSGAELRRLDARIARLTERADHSGAADAGRRTAGLPRPAEHAPLLPFSCPNCSAPLPLLPAARLHSCPICLRLWSVGAHGLELMPTRRLLPARGESGRVPRIECWLPFYRLRQGSEELYVPAFHGRHPRAVWNFSFALNRRAPRWTEVEECCRPGAAVERVASSAAALAPFLRYCLEREEAGGATQAELCWIGFVRRGPDWVEPGLGLGIPGTALNPWEATAELPMPAARTG